MIPVSSYKMVPQLSDGLDGTTYQISSQLPAEFVAGHEVAVKYYRWLQVSHSRQTGKFTH